MAKKTAGTPIIQLALSDPASTYHKLEKTTNRTRPRRAKLDKVRLLEERLFLCMDSFFVTIQQKTNNVIFIPNCNCSAVLQAFTGRLVSYTSALWAS
ncbi:MAG: hypothetical protein GQ542_10670 [Desulforhopalus sp.]|nr:hypothetical protein [Desulforhopalus sp.]